MRPGMPSGLRIDVDRRSVGEERHVLDREDLRDDALVAVTAGELVALGDLALLGDVDDHALVDARAELVVAVLRVEHLDGDDRALLTVGTFSDVSRTSRLFVEDRAEQALLGRQLGLALGVTLPTRMSPGGPRRRCG